MSTTPLHLSTRARKVSPFLVMDVLERAAAMEAQGTHIVHMEIGEPDFSPPACVARAACAAMDAGHTSYTHSQGILELRQAICELHARDYGVTVDPAQVIITSGTSPALSLTFTALLDPGDEVIITDPGYACYENFIRLAGGVPVRVPVHAADDFAPRPDAVAARVTERTRAVVLNSPANPTGAILSVAQYAELARALPDSVALVSDEVYHGLTYGEHAPCLLEAAAEVPGLAERAFVLNGFSKRFAMTGWRLGYMLAPAALMPTLQRMAQNLFICAGSVAQHGALAALRCGLDDAEAMRAAYAKRRDYMVERLTQMGLPPASAPRGAFYLLADVSHLTDDCLAFAFEVLEKAHVGITPGVDFGPGGEGYVRFSYANSLENIGEGCDRLERFLARRHNPKDTP